jgi:hypothetical protein
MILKTVLRAVWVICAFVIAAGVALAVLFALRANWVGDELRAAAPGDPLVRHGAPMLGVVLFAETIGPALTALPALVAAVAGEVLKIRSWMYYVLAGGLALASIPIIAAPKSADLSALLASHAMTIFAAAGFAGGFVYWLLAGARA